MKIERISENKIKCTLNREDLASHNIVLTEFAYGSEKARAFFRELMLQAEDEVGFEADDIPLMIEAVPINQDCIVLFVTKVSDPDELDTRFSRFSSSSDGEYEDDEEDSYDENEDADNVDFLGAVKDAVKNAVEGLARSVENVEVEIEDVSENDDFVPLNQSAKKLDSKKEAENKETKAYSVIYSFKKLDDVCDASKYVKNSYHGDNTLYKDMVEGTYFLVLSNGGTKPDTFTKVCNRLSEYGKRERSSYALQAYFEEHHLCVIRSNALQTLAEI